MSLVPEVPSFSNEFKAHDKNVIFKLSKLILINFPQYDVNSLFDNDISSSAASLSLDENSFKQLISDIHALWKYFIYHQPKEDEFKNVLSQAGIGEEFAQPFTDLWLFDGKSAIERVARSNSSGIPRVHDVDCTTQLRLSGNAIDDIKSPEIVITLQTSTGPKKLVMSREKATQLYYETNKIQAAVDKLLE